MERPDIDGMKARVDQASELFTGISHATDDGRHDSYVFDKYQVGLQIAKFGTRNHKANAIFYSHSRTDLPELLAWIEYLERGIREWNGTLTAITGKAHNF